MTLFGKRSAAMAKDEINAFLGAGTSYEGRLSFQGSVRIDGNFQGEVESEGVLVVGREAFIRGQVKVGQLISSGRIEGEIAAKERCVFHKTASFKGAVVTPALVVEDGAVIDGSVSMNTNGTPPALTE
jgi:cytoskeletal protein CcmA (bactofilin family)